MCVETSEASLQRGRACPRMDHSIRGVLKPDHLAALEGRERPRVDHFTRGALKLGCGHQGGVEHLSRPKRRDSLGER